MANYITIGSGDWNTSAPWMQIDQSYLVSNTAVALRYDAARTYISQGFTPASSYSVTNLYLNCYKVGSPTGNVWVEIWSNSSGKPNAIVGVASSNVDVSTISTTTTNYQVFTFPTPVAVTSGTAYHFVLRGDYTVSSTNYMAIRNHSAGTYAGGYLNYGTATPAWTSYTAYDLTFYIGYANNYPFYGSAADTAILDYGRTITIVADNANAGTGAVTINDGATLTNNYAQQQSFCGAITQNGIMNFSSGSIMRVKDGNVTGSVTAEFNFSANSILQFDLSSQGTNGFSTSQSKVHMAGTSEANKDCVIQGTLGKEAFATINYPDPYNNRININNATFQYLYKASNGSCVIFTGWNRYVNNCGVLGNVDFKNNVGGYELSLATGCNINTAGNINFLSEGMVYGSMTVGINCSIREGTWRNDSVTNPGLSGIQWLDYSICYGGTYNFKGDRNSNDYNPIDVSGYATLFGGTHTGTALNAAGCPIYVWGTVGKDVTLYGHSAATSTQWVAQIGTCLFEGTLIADAHGGANGVYFNGVVLRGNISISNTTQYAVGVIYGRTHIEESANIIIDNTNTGYGISYIMSGTTYPVDFEIKHGGGIVIANEATTKTYNGSTITQQIEPLIYVTDRANKYFSIDFMMAPWNSSDFATTGTVDFGNTTLGATTIVGAGTVTTPVVRPFDVTDWGTFTVTGTVTNCTYEYAVSTDGGLTFGSWVSIASGGSIGATPVGNYLDAIKFKITNSSGTASVTSMVISNNVYSDINGSVTNRPVIGILNKTGEQIVRLSATEPTIWDKI